MFKTQAKQSQLSFSFCVRLKTVLITRHAYNRTHFVLFIYFLNAQKKKKKKKKQHGLLRLAILYKTNKIYHQPPMLIEKSQPEVYRFSGIIRYPRVGVSRFGSETDFLHTSSGKDFHALLEVVWNNTACIKQLLFNGLLLKR